MQSSFLELSLQLAKINLHLHIDTWSNAGFVVRFKEYIKHSIFNK